MVENILASRFLPGETQRTIYFCNFVIVGLEPVLKENKKTNKLKTCYLEKMKNMVGQKNTNGNNIYNLWRARSWAQFPWSFFSGGPGR